MQYGLEKSFKSRPDHSLDNPYSVLSNIIDEVENGELSQIHNLSVLYNDKKTKLLNNVSSQNKLQLFEYEFMSAITSEINALQDKKQSWSEARKKIREVSVSNRINKYR